MLTISKASAGAGKTYKLTGHYLRLLFEEFRQGREEPYRHILAVTFTNKATAEMKERILKELNLLSDGSPSDFLPELVHIVKDSGLTSAQKEAEVRKWAGTLLRAILNDYTGFNVSTIDSFFQMILRAFAREMGQSSTYTVNIDNNEILVQAVDSLMASLDENGKADLLRWLTDMAVEEIEQGRGWDITSRLYGLGEFVFSEQFRLKGGGSSMDRQAMASLRSELKELRRGLETEVSAMASEALGLIRSAGLSVTDFSGGSRSGMCSLDKLSRGEMTMSAGFVKMAVACDPAGSWYAKNSPFKTVISELFSSSLGERVREIHSLLSSDRYADYVTAGLILRNFSMLGVVNDLRAEMEKLSRENNSVILSETNDFLRRVIDREETPFIYEKAATRIDSYMLDEFQDTSAMQWENFSPLVTDSVDSGHSCLIVGDAKQSIYRWRNSDWHLLSSVVPQQFDGRKKDEPLGENWRTGKSIVYFNNAFFNWVGKSIQKLYNENTGASSTMISDIYSDTIQKIPSKRKDAPGHVMVNFVPDSEDRKWKEAVLDLLPDRINALISNGMNPGDIAVLVRSNEEGSQVSNFLISRHYNIVTEDSLKISASESVQKVVAVLSYMLHPDDRMSGWLYEKSGISLSGTLDMPLYDLCEWTVSRLGETDRAQVAFLQAFMDCVKDYVSKSGSDLGGFLRWWREYGAKLSISAPEGVSSIRVMTIHKSKGLGVKAVIIPFLSCELSGSRGVIWCRSDREPFCRAGVIPVGISKDMLNSDFRQAYLNEMLYQYVDSLNMAYVAFTRAICELHIFAQLPKKQDTFNSMGQALHFWLKKTGRFRNECYEFGEWYKSSPGESASEKTSCAGSSLFPVPASFDSCPGNERIKVSLRNAEKMSESYAARLHGVVMHDIFSRIDTEEDAASAAEAAVSDGDITASEKEQVLEQVFFRLAQARQAGYRWFDGSFKVICEVPVLYPGGMERRPDRVMVSGNQAVVVDYKFGAEHSSSYIRQVAGYMHTLQDMGYSDVRGYLWYNEGIEEVIFDMV